MPLLEVFYVTPQDALRETTHQEDIDIFNDGCSKWELVLADSTTRTRFEELYNCHSGEVDLMRLLYLDEGLVDIFFDDAPMGLDLPAVQHMDDNVFSKLSRRFASSICFEVRMPNFNFTDGHRAMLAARKLVLLDKGVISNTVNIQRRDRSAQRSK